ARRIPRRAAEPDQRARRAVRDRAHRLCADLYRQPADAAVDPVEYRLRHQCRNLLPAADPDLLERLTISPVINPARAPQTNSGLTNFVLILKSSIRLLLVRTDCPRLVSHGGCRHRWSLSIPSNAKERFLPQANAAAFAD